MCYEEWQPHPGQQQHPQLETAVVLLRTALCLRIQSDVTPNTNNCSALPWSDTPVQTPDPSAPSGGPSPGCFHHTRGAALMCLCLHVPGPSYFWLCESSCFSLGLSCSLLGRNTKSAIPHALSWLADSYCSILNTTIQKQLFQS